MRQFVLACLRVNLKQFHLYLVAFLDSSLFNSLKALPVYLADVQQAILAGENLHETSVRHDGTYCSLIYLAYLRNGHNGANLCQGSVDALLVWTAHLHLAHAVNLVDGDG